MRLDRPNTYWHSQPNSSLRCGLTSVDTHPSGRFATGGEDGCVRIWKLRRNLRHLKQLQLNRPIQLQIKSLTESLSALTPTSPQHAEIALQISELHNKAESMLTQAGPYYHFDLLSEFQAAEKPITNLRFSPNGQLLAVGSDGQEIALYRFQCYGFTKREFAGASSHNDFGNYNIETWTLAWSLSNQFELTGCSWGADSLSLYLCGIKGEVALLHVNLEPHFVTKNNKNASKVPYLLENLDFPTTFVANSRRIEEFTAAQRTNPLPIFPNNPATTYADEIADVNAMDDLQLAVAAPNGSFSRQKSSSTSVTDQTDLLSSTTIEPTLLPQMNSTQTSWLSNTVLNAVKSLIASLEQHDIDGKAYNDNYTSILHPDNLHTLHNPLFHSLFQLPYHDYCLFTQTPLIDIDGVVVDGTKGKLFDIAETDLVDQSSTPTTSTSPLATILQKIDLSAIVNRYIFDPTTNNTMTTKRPAAYTSDLSTPIPLHQLLKLPTDGMSDRTSTTTAFDAKSTMNDETAASRFSTSTPNKPTPTDKSPVKLVSGPVQNNPNSKPESKEKQTSFQLDADDDDDDDDDGFGKMTDGNNRIDLACSKTSGNTDDEPVQDELFSQSQSQTQSQHSQSENPTNVVKKSRTRRTKKPEDNQVENLFREYKGTSALVVKIGDKSTQLKAQRKAYLQARDMGDLTVDEILELQRYAEEAADANLDDDLAALTEDLITIPMAFPQSGISELFHDQMNCQIDAFSSANAAGSIAQGIATDPFGKYIACVFNKTSMIIYKKREPKVAVATSLKEEKPTKGAANADNVPADGQQSDGESEDDDVLPFKRVHRIDTVKANPAQFITSSNLHRDQNAGAAQGVKTFSIVAPEKGAYFFRRPDWSPDGLYLACPAGSLPSSTAPTALLEELDASACKIAPKAGAVVSEADSTTNQSQPVTNPHSIPIQDGLMVTHIFSRFNLNQPILSLPSPVNEPTIAVRFNPVPFLSTPTAKQLNTIINNHRNSALTTSLASTIAKTLSGTSYYYLLAVAGPTHLTVYRTDTFQPILTSQNAHSSPFSDISWFHDGLKLVCTAHDGKCSFLTIQQSIPDDIPLSELSTATSITFSPYINSRREQEELIASSNTSNMASMSMEEKEQLSDHFLLAKNKTDVGVVLTGFPKFLYDSYISSLKRISSATLQHNYKQNAPQRSTIIRDGYDALQFVLQDVVVEVYKQTFAQHFGYQLTGPNHPPTAQSESEDIAFAAFADLLTAILFGSLSLHIAGVVKDDITQHMASLPVLQKSGNILVALDSAPKATKRKQPSSAPITASSTSTATTPSSSAINLCTPITSFDDTATTPSNPDSVQVTEPTRVTEAEKLAPLKPKVSLPHHRGEEVELFPPNTPTTTTTGEEDKESHQPIKKQRL